MDASHIASAYGIAAAVVFCSTESAVDTMHQTSQFKDPEPVLADDTALCSILHYRDSVSCVNAIQCTMVEVSCQ